MVRLQVEARQQILKGAAGGAMMQPEWYRLQVVAVRDFSGAAGGAAMISAILICAAACGSGSSSTGALQVVQW